MRIPRDGEQMWGGGTSKGDGRGKQLDNGGSLWVIKMFKQELQSAATCWGSPLKTWIRKPQEFQNDEHRASTQRVAKSRSNGVWFWGLYSSSRDLSSS